MFSVLGLQHVRYCSCNDVLYLLVRYTGCIMFTSQVHRMYYTTSHIHRMYCIYRSHARMWGVPAYAFYGHFCWCTSQMSRIKRTMHSALTHLFSFLLTLSRTFYDWLTTRYKCKWRSYLVYRLFVCAFKYCYGMSQYCLLCLTLLLLLTGIACL